MNYACLLLGATFVFAVAYWYLWGRTVYVGPRVNVELVEDMEPKTSEELFDPAATEKTGEKAELGKEM